MTEETQEITAAETPPPVEPVAEPPEVVAEPESQPEPEPKPQSEPKKQEWYYQRISEESAKARQAAERAEAAERRAREAEELLQRFNQKSPERPVDPVPRYANEQATRQDEIRRAAQQLRFEEDVRDLNDAGARDFGADFDSKVNILASVTGQGEPLFEFVNDVMSIDKTNAHTILHQLGSDPDEAARLARMNPKQRIAALVRMTMAQTTPETKPATASAPTRQLSKAPAPAPALQPAAHKTINYLSPEGDKMSDEDWYKAYDADERRKTRSARL